MSENKRAPTPGPWLLTNYHVHDADHIAIANVALGFNDPISRANARLIAAAPDLLAALEAADRALRKSHYSGPERDLIDAALSKSRGEG